MSIIITSLPPLSSSSLDTSSLSTWSGREVQVFWWSEVSLNIGLGAIWRPDSQFLYFWWIEVRVKPPRTGWLATQPWSSMPGNRCTFFNGGRQCPMIIVTNFIATDHRGQSIFDDDCEETQGAALVLLEHRFYGQSRPTNNTRWKDFQNQQDHNTRLISTPTTSCSSWSSSIIFHQCWKPWAALLSPSSCRSCSFHCHNQVLLLINGDPIANLGRGIYPFEDNEDDDR